MQTNIVIVNKHFFLNRIYNVLPQFNRDYWKYSHTLLKLWASHLALHIQVFRKVMRNFTHSLVKHPLGGEWQICINVLPNVLVSGLGSCPHLVLIESQVNEPIIPRHHFVIVQVHLVSGGLAQTVLLLLGSYRWYCCL